MKKAVEMSTDMRTKVLSLFGNLPYNERGIKINDELIITTMEILNSCDNKKLPQNCRKESVENTPFGLDKLIKERFCNSTMRATIISDELEKRGIVRVYQDINEKTHRLIKFTELNKEWAW